jgi:hypothetical protein
MFFDSKGDEIFLDVLDYVRDNFLVNDGLLGELAV